MRSVFGLMLRRRRAARPRAGRGRRFAPLAAFALALTVCLVAGAHAQERRVALIIGNTEYEHVLALDNPQNDARAISAALRGLGFEVYEHIDLDRSATENAIREFGRSLRDADIALLFYAGHAIQYEGVNYLVPTDAQLEAEGDIDFELVDVDLIIKQMQSEPRISLIFLDACRDNPFTQLQRSVRGSQREGLAPIASMRGTFIAYATAPDRVAYDGEGNHSPFTNALLEHIDAEGVEIRTMMTRVRQDVFESTGGLQLPWDHSSLLTEFYFQPAAASGELATADPVFQDLKRVLELPDPDHQRRSLSSFLNENADSPYAEIARLKLRELTAPPATSDNRQPMLDFIPPLAVEGGTVKAPLSIPAPRDPDAGDQLRARVVELPARGTIRNRGLQLKSGDELSIQQLTGLEYYLPPDAVGDAGQFAFQVYDSRGGSVLGAVPIRILAPNQPPRLEIPPTVTATVGARGLPLDLRPPVDPDPEDRVIVRVDRLPEQGALTLNDVELFPGAAVSGEDLTRIVYIPPATFSSPEAGAIRFVAEDGRGGRTLAEMAIVLTSANRPPAWLADQSLRVDANTGEATVSVPWPTDPDADDMTVSVARLPFTGSVRAASRAVQRGDTLTPDDVATLSYEPPADFAGAAGRLTLQADDGRGGITTHSVTVLVEPRNRAPIVDPEREIVAVAGEVMPLGLTRPIDPDGHDMVVRLLAVPANGEVLIGDRPARAGMALTIAELGEARFRAGPGAAGTTGTLTYAVADDRGAIARGNVLIRVRAPNRPPNAAAPRTVTTNADEAPVALVADPPSDPDGDPLEVRVQALPVGGEVVVEGRTLRLGDRLSADQLLTAAYRVTGDFVGPAGSFRYAVLDGQGGVATGETRVVVEEPNRPPLIAYGTFVEIPANVGPVSLNLRGPEDPDGDPLSITLLDVPQSSTLRVGDRPLAAGDRLSVDEFMALTAEAGLEAVDARDSVLFDVTDSRGATVRGELVIQVAPPPNRPPRVVAPSEVAAEATGSPVPMNIAAPTDPDGDPLVITVTVLPRSGEIRVDDRVIGVGDRLSPDDLTRLTYQPPQFAGPMGRFAYDVRDDRGGSTSGAVTLTATKPNRPPIAFVELPVEVVEGAPARPVPVPMRLPLDPDGDPIEIEVSEVPTVGQVRVDDRPLAVGDELQPEALDRLIYHAADAAPGAEGTFAYVARDSRGGEATGSVGLRVVRANQPPEVPADATVTLRGGDETVLVLEDLPSDPDGDPLTATVLRMPYAGALEVGSRRLRAGEVLSVDELAFLRYRPDPGFHGQAGTFRYRVEDSRGGASVSTVTILVERPNQPPVGTGTRAVQVVAGAGPRPLGLETPIDPDGDPLIAEVVAVPSSGTVRQDDRELAPGAEVPAEDLARLTFDAAAGVTGPLGEVRIEVRDDRGGVAVVGVTVTAELPPNRPPIILSRGGVAAVQGEGPKSLGLSVPQDPDGDPLTVTVVEVPRQGRLLLRDRELEVGSQLAPEEVPEIAFDTAGADPGHAGAFQVEVADARDGVAQARVPIEVLLPPNTAPEAVTPQTVDAVVGVGTVSLPVKPPFDPDDDPVVIRLTSVPSNGVLTFAGRVAEKDMELTPEDFAQARFTPNRDPALSRSAMVASSLAYEVNDGRGGIAAGEVVVRAQMHECDQLASSADNIESVAPGVALSDLQIERAVAACNDALAEFGSIGRFRFQLARAQQAGGQFRDALENYRVAARMGDWAAKHNLGVLLFDPPPGADVRRDVDEAVRWLREASEEGSTPAQKSLASVIWHGEGVDAGQEDAVRWLLEATKQNDPEALTHLAMAYATGEGIERNVDEAVRLLERAAARGHAPAQTNLGYLYANGDVGRVDLEQARKWFTAAAEQRDSRGLLNLGALYLYGTGVKRDTVRAVKLFAAAVRQADPDVERAVRQSLEGLSEGVVVEAVQALLTERGYRPGPIDGQMGRRTRTALMEFERAEGLAETGEPAPGVLLALAAPR